MREGINLDNYLEELKENGEESNPEHLMRGDRKDEYLQLRIRGLYGKPGRGGSLRDVDEQ